MGAQYSQIVSSESTDRATGGIFSLIHLSDGTAVWLAYNNTTATLSLYHGGTDHKTPALIGAVSPGINPVPSSPLPQGAALCRDAADNLYVVGVSAGGSGGLTAQGWTKNAGYSWTGQFFFNVGLVTTTLAGIACSWVSSGDFVFVVFTGSSGVARGWVTLSASGLRVGSGSTLGSGSNPTFMGSSVAIARGANLDLSPQGFGSSTFLVLSTESTAFVGVGAVTLNIAGSITSNALVTSMSGAVSTTTKYRIIYLGDGGAGTPRWLAIYPTSSTAWTYNVFSATASVFSGSLTTGSVTNLPVAGATLMWDAFVDVTTVGTSSPVVWMLVFDNSTTPGQVWRASIAVSISGGTASHDTAAVLADTLTAVSAVAECSLRTVKEPVGSIFDWQVSCEANATPTFGLYGDWTTSIVQGVVALSATASATVGGVVSKLATTSMAAVAGATAGATVKEVATVSMTAATSLTTSGKVTQIAVVSAAAVAGMTASGQVTKFASVSAAAVTGMTTSGQVTELATVAMSALASLTSSAGVTEVDSLVAAAVTSAVAGGLVTVLAVVPMHAVAGATVTVTLVQTFAGVSMTAVSSMIVGVVVATTGAVSEAALASMSVAAAISEIAVVAMSTITGATLAGQVTSIAAVVMAGASGASVTSAVSVFASALFMAAVAGAGVVAEGTTFGAVSMSASTAMLIGTLVTEVTGVSMTAVGNMFVAGAPVRASSINMLANAAMSVAGVASALAFVSMTATSSAGVPLVDVTVVTAVAMALEASAAVAATAASVGSVDMVSTAGVLIAVVLHVINTAMASAATSATIQAQVTEVIHPARLMAMVIGGRTTGVDRRMVATPTGPVRRI